MRIKRTVHDNGDVSLRLTLDHVEALMAQLRFSSVQQMARRQRDGEFVASFDMTKLEDIDNALEREGRRSTPEERGIDWKTGKRINLS